MSYLALHLPIGVGWVAHKSLVTGLIPKIEPPPFGFDSWRLGIGLGLGTRAWQLLS